MEMRYLKTTGLAVFTLAFLTLSPGAARAQYGAPAGSYAQTCRDIRTNGSTLEATCDNGNGGWDRTSLQNFDQCTGGIENLSGRLACNRGGYNGPAYGGDRRDGGPDRRDYGRDGVPDGGYVQTCRDISSNGNTLQATCQKRNGRWRQTSLSNFNQCRSSIENNNGRLTCSKYERR